jgi:hypothetical protein
VEKVLREMVGKSGCAEKGKGGRQYKQRSNDISVKNVNIFCIPTTFL